MSNEHDWLSKCVKEIDVTDVGEKYYSLLYQRYTDRIDLDIDITDDFFDIDK